MSEQFNKGKQLIGAIILGFSHTGYLHSLFEYRTTCSTFYHVDMSIVNIAVSLTSLLTGVFIVVAGDYLIK